MALKAPDAPAFPFLAGRDQKVPVIFGKPGDCRVYSVVFCVLSVLNIRSNRKYWYRVYSDGWIEQGGRSGSVGYDTTTTITLNKSFQNTNYLTTVGYINSTESDSMVMHTTVQNTANFKVRLRRSENSGSGTRYVTWYACGY